MRLRLRLRLRRRLKASRWLQKVRVLLLRLELVKETTRKSGKA